MGGCWPYELPFKAEIVNALLLVLYKITGCICQNRSAFYFKIWFDTLLDTWWHWSAWCPTYFGDLTGNVGWFEWCGLFGVDCLAMVSWACRGCCSSGSGPAPTSGRGSALPPPNLQHGISWNPPCFPPATQGYHAPGRDHAGEAAAAGDLPLHPHVPRGQPARGRAAQLCLRGSVFPQLQ